MNTVVCIEANTRGRDFVVGDIHGWLEPLNAELEAVCFNRDVDRLFSVGDLIDRGPHSRECFELINEPWFFAVRGNHEQIMFDWLEDPTSIETSDWMRFGGKSWMGPGPEHFFLRNPGFKRFAEQQAEQMPWAIELDLADGRKIGITHSSVPVDDWLDLKLRLPSEPAIRNALIWDRPVKHPDYRHQVEGIDLTVHGHVILPQVEKRGNGIYIDTGAALFEQSSTVAPGSVCPHPRISAIEVTDLFHITDSYLTA
ncbi:metallophosphoesterase [Marinobacterium sp. YM272]|uniref:metallophosphoesterase n=1 Tax=Marinobacterium sp. YM272 TaxID=3421654 RepID=UPI003D7FDAEF